MNIRFVSLSIAIALLMAGAFALPVFAQEDNTSNYGAGFIPSPTYTKEPVYAPTTAQNPAQYGAGFGGSPVISQTELHTQYVSSGHYGAGFYGAPSVAFSNRYRGVGFYGAGYNPSPWYGGGLRLFGFGAFNRWYW